MLVDFEIRGMLSVVYDTLYCTVGGILNRSKGSILEMTDNTGRGLECVGFPSLY